MIELSHDREFSPPTAFFFSIADLYASLGGELMDCTVIYNRFRMMPGFGVHTFRLINEAGKSTFVKFHFTPQLGTHSLVWDEALKLCGQGKFVTNTF